MSQIFVALDYSNSEDALRMALQLKGKDVGVKVGKQLFTAEGPQLVRELVSSGFQVFLDLKYHDVPNTVAGAVKAAARLGVSMVSVHCSGGPRMMQAAAKAAALYKQECGTRPLVVGVTVLTSLDQQSIEAVQGVQELGIWEKVQLMAQQANLWGLDGVVCSGREIQLVRKVIFTAEFRIVVPGIRNAELGDKSDDQVRTMTASQAIAEGATDLVIGRPITGSTDPMAALEDFRMQTLPARAV